VVKVTENIPFHPRLWPYVWFRRSVRRHAKRFVCVSESARAALLQEGFDGDQIQLIPEPVDLEMFRPLPPAESARTFTVGYAAKLDLIHGFPDLLHAFALLAQSVTARLKIAGEGPFAADLSDCLRRLDIEGRVEYVGQIPYTEMPRFLRDIDVLCVPCTEGPGWKPQFGIVNIEAMACGRPIVATRAGATPEIVPPGLHPFLASPGDVAGLAERLTALAVDAGLRRRLGQEARAWVAERYDKLKIAARWATLISEVASEVGRP
jgi:glycosyltransferase involved in cell wall biosynthesis